ncbi:hypothetical protein B7486_15415 [cyanobacterium TDX16]|nr:hypothetical protein B7486_15415 [cyanobacterium TDX16]
MLEVVCGLSVGFHVAVIAYVVTLTGLADSGPAVGVVGVSLDEDPGAAQDQANIIPSTREKQDAKRAWGRIADKELSRRGNVGEGDRDSRAPCWLYSHSSLHPLTSE